MPASTIAVLSAAPLGSGMPGVMLWVWMTGPIASAIACEAAQALSTNAGNPGSSVMRWRFSGQRVPLWTVVPIALRSMWANRARRPLRVRPPSAVGPQRQA
ncbi:hypothetical protein PANO111632_00165 [Paracoccus nototheniae]